MRNTILACAMIGLLGCGVGEDGTGPNEPPAPQAPPSGRDATPSTPSAPSAGEDAGQPPDAASACPNLTGSWSGKLDGTITGEAQGKITGTATLLFAVGAAHDEYALLNGSQLALNVDVDGTIVPVAQAVAGSARCGVLDVAQDSQIFGKDVHATVKCTFTGAECSGTWTAVAKDASGNAYGTFTVSKH